MSVLLGPSIVPAGDEAFRQVLAEWARQAGVGASLTVEPWVTLQARAAAMQANGPDIVALQWFGSAQLAENLADLSDLGHTLEQRWGGLLDGAKATAVVAGVYRAIPLGAPASAVVYRPALLQKAGVPRFPDTWEELFKASATLKQAAHPFALSLGHTLGDPLSFVYPFMYSYGAAEVAEDGKSAGFATPAFTDALQRFATAWHDGFDERGLSGNDDFNDGAFLSGQAWATSNDAAIYVGAKQENPSLARDLDHARNPSGPAGRFATFQTRQLAVLGNSPNQAAAKEFLAYFYSDDVYRQWLRAQQGVHLPPTNTRFLDDPVFSADPKLKPFADQAKLLRLPGAATAPVASATSLSRYVIVEMFAQAAQTGDARKAIADAAQKVESIFGA